MRRVASLAVLLALVVGVAPALANAQAAAPADPVRPLLDRLEQAVLTGTPAAYLALVSDAADRAAAQQFAAQHLGPGVTHVTIRERDRAPLAGTLPGNGYRVTTDVFIQRGHEARLVTWRLDLRRRSSNENDASRAAPAQPEWSIVGQDVLGIVEGLRHLALDVTKELDAHDLVIHAEDFDLKLAAGQVFTAATREGTTALLLMGRGQMVFRPAPATERGQVKIFCGSETLDTSFDMAFVRVNPADLEAHLQTSALVPRAAADASDAKRANDFFDAELVQSFTLDLSEFSPESWSLLPPAGDFLTEVHTDRFGTLTYARSNADPEDLTLFDRKHQHNIALYASKEKLAARGRFYNEDDLAEFEVEHYDVDASLDPARLWIAGRTQLTIRVRADSINHLTLKLADPLTVRSVFSQQYGRLLALRVRNQNSIVVNLPSFVTRDTQFSVTIAYAGRVPPQETTRETITVGQFPRQSGPVIPSDVPRIDPEPSFLYSNQSFWYPQAPIDGYATATLRLTVPPDYQCVASGAMASGSPVALPATDTVPARKLYVFTATQPLRYLACVLSHFASLATDPVTVSVPSAPAPKVIGDDPPPARQPGVYYDSLKLSVEAPKRQLSQEQALQDKAADIAAFYASLLHDVPYPTFTVAIVESNLPGGHSPGYFAVLNQPLPTTPFTWRHDPASFEDFPEFFLAHELAHQWWGQAIGPANYHEQWLSEGFAQYFAVLYAERRRGDEVFDNILHKLRQWSIDDSDQGPIYLGYRLGHIKNDGRVYRALVYDKGAMVLHMLRRLLGDQTFFEGLRHFYLSSRFHKVGTDDLRKSMETVAHRPLERFFDRWIYEAGIPHVTWSSRVDAGPHGPELVVHAEEQGSLVYDLPVTVTVSYSDKPALQVVMPITGRVTDFRIPLTGQFRGVDLNRDDGALGIFDKK